MGSSQPSDSNLVFGYSIDQSQDFFLDPPPEPAPGAPLLSDNDSKIISSFFDDMTADHYNVPSFGEGLNYSDAWLSLPPQFMGTATSLGQASLGQPLSSPGHDMHHQDFSDLMPLGSSMMPPPPPPQQHQQQQQHQHQQHMMSQPRPSVEQQPSPDVLAAATLLQNGSSSRHHFPNSGGSVFSPQQRGMPSPLGPHGGHLRHQPLDEFKRAERTNGFADSGMEEQHVAMFTDLVFGPSPAAPSRPAPPPPRANHVPMEMQWGSDARFSSRSHSFVPDSAGETYDALAKNQLRHMECLEPSRSASNTRPSSPMANGESSGTQAKKAPESSSGRLADASEGPPRKRRKSRSAKEEPDDDASDDAEPPFKGARRRKGKENAVAGAGAAPPLPTENGSAGRRRKSATGPKPQRENLSEAQKRENHIRSEQKRRTLIKEGFDDLCDLVPGLKGGGFSKSTMLTMAADWLEDMLQGNEKITAQLNKLEGRA